MRLLVALPLLLAIANCSNQPNFIRSASGTNPYPTSTAQLEAGRKIYNFRCYFCHGYSGNAQTVAASFLSPPPIDFTKADSSKLTPEYIVSVLHEGKAGTAMKSFRHVLGDIEMEQVALFVVNEFVVRKAPNTRYHIPENGWPEHERYQAAFPFATGEISINQPWETLSDTQIRGKHLFLSGCIICHDRGSQGNDSVVWEGRPLSYPRNHYSHIVPQTDLDATTSASPYRLHDIPPEIENLSPLENRGRKLFNDNCAFCHGADGTGKNWIGSFLESHPRNLRDPEFMAGMTRSILANTIREGLPNTSMPAWKSVLSPEEIEAIIAYIAKAFYPLKN